MDTFKSFPFLMKHDEGISLIMMVTMVLVPLQIITRIDLEELSATPAYAKNPFFASLLPMSKTASSDIKQKYFSAVEVNKIIVDILRVTLELQLNERLDTTLISRRTDSITFTQFKGQILKELEIDVPMGFLPDSFTSAR